MSTYVIASTNTPDPSKAVIPLTPIPDGVVHPVLGRIEHKIKVGPDSSESEFYERLTNEQAEAALAEWSSGALTIDVAAHYHCSITTLNSLYIMTLCGRLRMPQTNG